MSEILITSIEAEEIFAKLEITACKHCLTPLPHDVIHCYEHSNGWVVKGFEKKQWLFIICPKCFYQWSLWKLGYSQAKSEVVTADPKSEEEKFEDKVTKRYDKDWTNWDESEVVH
jgi:hypothetical protein